MRKHIRHETTIGEMSSSASATNQLIGGHQLWRSCVQFQYLTLVTGGALTPDAPSRSMDVNNIMIIITRMLHVANVDQFIILISRFT